MGRPGRDDRLTYVQNLTCALGAGVIARSLVSPLDVVKIMSQVGTKETQEGFRRTFVNIFRTQGIRAFWKGNLIGCLRLTPFNTIQFGAYHRIKLKLADENGRLTADKAMVAGGLGGMVATMITYPTDMVKTRLIVQHTDAKKKRYHGILKAFSLIFKEEGLLSFYRGMFVSLLGAIPFTAATFTFYELTDEFMNSRLGKPYHIRTASENLTLGCMAAAFAQTASFPFDTIRKKLQAQSRVMADGGGVDVKFRGAIGAVRATNAKYGYKGLYKGNGANLLKIVPYALVMFLMFEGSKRYFLYQNGYTESPLDSTPKPNVDQTLRPQELKTMVDTFQRKVQNR